jgi:AcrR family transcriptional regulator
MPRKPDPDLEDRILKAAHMLWKRGGEKSLTMRAVAQAAGTNTPAVYRRFKDRRDLLRALVLGIRQRVVKELKASATPEEACERYLDFALRHPNEYELFFQHDYELLHKARSGERPGVDAMRSKLAETLGGAPEDHAELGLSLWMVAHGAAMLMIAKTIPPQQVTAARRVFTATAKTLLEEALSTAAR